ncbi:amino acid permease [Govanella unica]|uniref:Amino acid permease n=1 Tax=Govanella unica TaxID=2975056 RepID=A0A9X3Z880_9PROT|nr:amino acid permease [Govania unica]MDA5194749.1 amino acid permease [Govania unica]
MGLWTRKDINTLQMEALAGADVHGNSLKRVLSAYQLIMLGIGAIIGAGIFVITGEAAANYAGPGVMFSFMVAALGCFFAGLCYAEFASMIPVAGSAYTYAYATLGEFIAWIIGWDLVLEYLVASSTVSVGWSGYFTAFMHEIGIFIPAVLTSAPLAYNDGQFHLTGSFINFPAVLLVGIITSILVFGIEMSARFNNVIVMIKVAVVLLVIGIGIQHINWANLDPLVPPNTGKFGEYGFSGVIRASAVVFFAYIGFDAVSTAAQEAKNPQRDMPIGILGSLAICTVLYILMAFVMTGLAHYTTLNVPHPVFVAINTLGPTYAWLGMLVNIGAIMGLASVILVLLMGQPRIFMSMSRDGLLPGAFGRVHSKYRTPYVGTIITGSAAAILGGLLPIDVLGKLVSMGTLLAFVIVCAGVLVLRHTSPDLKRPFRTPFLPFVPLAGIGICGYMMVSLPAETWLLVTVWTVIGLAIYFLYGKKRSRLGKAAAAE